MPTATPSHILAGIGLLFAIVSVLPHAPTVYLLTVAVILACIAVLLG